jgi:hypothetical protein
MLFKPKSGLWFAPSTDNATGTSPVQTPDTTPPAEPGGSNGGATGPQATAPASPAATAKPLTFESEEKLERYIEDALKERLERAQKKADKLAAEAREKAEADAAVKNGEWQKLAETRESKLKELSAQLETIPGLQTKAERYEKALNAYLATQRSGLPAHVTVLLDKLDPVDQLEYIAKNREALSQNVSIANAGSAHIPPTPTAGNPGQITSEQMNQARQAQLARTKSNF